MLRQRNLHFSTYFVLCYLNAIYIRSTKFTITVCYMISSILCQHNFHYVIPFYVTLHYFNTIYVTVLCQNNLHYLIVCLYNFCYVNIISMMLCQHNSHYVNL